MDEKQLKLLIFEDNADDAELEVMELKREGFIVNWNRVETENAFRKGLAENPDLLLVDYNVPSFNGMAALQMRQEIAPEIPLIIVSGAIGEEVAVECMKSGATDYVLKDRLSGLGAVVKRALKEAEANRERKRAEQALRESEEQFRTIVETAPGLLTITDTKGNNIYVSPSCEEITGYTQEDLQDKIIWWVHEDDKQRAKQIFNRTFREGVGFKNFEYKLVRKNGELCYASSSWEPLKDSEGKFKGIVFQTIDITGRKQAEEEREKLISELQESLAKIKTLSGLLPICASCKKIKDDKGYWQQVEIFIEDRSMVEFSHALCPDCRKKLYPELYKDKDDNTRKD